MSAPARFHPGTRTPEHYYQEMAEMLDKQEPLAEVSREHLFAMHAFCFAFYDMGLLTLEDYRKLRLRIGLTVEEVDALPI